VYGALQDSMTADYRSGLAGFVVIAFGLSWLCWIPAALSDEGFSSSWVRWLGYAGALGPAVAGIALTYRTRDEKGRDDYWARVTDFSRIRRRWWIPILLPYPLATLLALLCDTAVTGVGPNLQMARRVLSEPSSIPVFMIWILLLGPLPEELGWRGYALDQLQRNWSALTSSLILGVIWAVWHLPLFFVKGSYQHNLGLGSLSFWSYSVTVVELSVLFTWIYNNNARSVLAAILFHFVLNLTGSLVQGSSVAEVARALLLAAAVGFVICAWTPRTLSTFRPYDRR
jgi:membrane protease YdiL (CAAX protease family)